MQIVGPLLTTIQMNYRSLMKDARVNVGRMDFASYALAFESALQVIRRAARRRAMIENEYRLDPITAYGHEIAYYINWMKEAKERLDGVSDKQEN